MKLFLFFGSLLLIIVASVGLKSNLDKLSVQENGEIIEVKIIHIPQCGDRKSNHRMRFEYNGKIYNKDVGCDFIKNHEVGGQLRLKYLEEKGVFLFEEERVQFEIISCIILIVILIACILFQMNLKFKQ